MINKIEAMNLKLITFTIDYMLQLDMKCTAIQRIDFICDTFNTALRTTVHPRNYVRTRCELHPFQSSSNPRTKGIALRKHT